MPSYYAKNDKISTPVHQSNSSSPVQSNSSANPHLLELYIKQTNFFSYNYDEESPTDIQYSSDYSGMDNDISPSQDNEG
ncbi:hypothetical protein TNIN_453701 [Trichonephila inaurata madagascariensis]|uniref:Uncharacterized protein n=1 Tax=Trichonephila inaurata madagascariensis TaxID=2747483 RepID=A0A8X7BU78_9ARAC|nr:hypothetical protein TNIN_453701 [Trichonephila inaurata madagascariensis]